MAKRGSSGHSLAVGVDKPAGMTSHDVVDEVRRIFGERRVGHAGTLDPAATGVLVVCVGPAARLDRFLSGHTKSYEFTCVFGAQTATDDAEGEVVATAPVPSKAHDASAAEEVLASMRGPSMQLPPAYSAIKVAGKASYAQARRGTPVSLDPRPVVVHALDLLDIEDNVDGLAWRLRADVSAGTYIRALARDIGSALGTCAHVGCLRRTRSGTVNVDSCVSLDTLAADPFSYLLDPVRLLQCRMLFADGALAGRISSGSPVPVREAQLFAYCGPDDPASCSCTSGIAPSSAPLAPGEIVGIIVDNRLCALYAFDDDAGMLKSTCGFSIGVARGARL